MVMVVIGMTAGGVTGETGVIAGVLADGGAAHLLHGIVRVDVMVMVEMLAV